MRIALGLFALALAAAPAFAAEHVLALDPASAQVTFFLGATGHDVNGSFPLTKCDIHFDPESGAAFGEISLDAAHSVSGHPKRDKTMHEKVLLSSANPLITFHPKHFEGTLPESGEGHVKLDGVVMLVGQEHPLSLDARLTRTGDKVHLLTTFPIPFVDWGLKDPSVMFLKVEKTVQLTVEGDATLAVAQATGH